jgi:DNA polymerase-3 subunit epsilon
MKKKSSSPIAFSSPTCKDARFVAIDFESTGEHAGEGGQPIQIGIAEIRSLEFDRNSFFSSYLKTDLPITKTAGKIHGITTAPLKHPPSLLELWPELQRRLSGRCLVAHGHGTERRFLGAFPMHGFGPWIDTLTLSRRFFPNLSSYALADVVAHCHLTEELYALHPIFRWHEALSDAIASLFILLYLIKTADLFEHRISFLTSPV